VGERVALDIQRKGEPMSVELVTAASPTPPQRPIIGVSIATEGFNIQTPFQVNITSDNVGGPSAGFMFALATLDGVTDGDLTRGHFVAGTGTIALDGTVGPVGGTAEKALGAERDGADVFLAPKADAEEAGRWVHNLKVVPIERFDDAVKALCALPPNTERLASTDAPTPCA